MHTVQSVHISSFKPHSFHLQSTHREAVMFSHDVRPCGFTRAEWKTLTKVRVWARNVTDFKHNDVFPSINSSDCTEMQWCWASEISAQHWSLKGVEYAFRKLIFGLWSLLTLYTLVFRTSLSSSTLCRSSHTLMIITVITSTTTTATWTTIKM